MHMNWYAKAFICYTSIIVYTLVYSTTRLVCRTPDPQWWGYNKKNKEQSNTIVEDQHHYWGCESMHNIMATERGGWKCRPAIILWVMQIRITGRSKNTGSQCQRVARRAFSSWKLRPLGFELYILVGNLCWVHTVHFSTWLVWVC